MSICRMNAALLLAAVASLSWTADATVAGPKVTVGRAVPAGQRVSMDQVDHSGWNALLQRHVDKNGNVAYAAWKASERDVATLDAYLNELSRAEPRARTTAPARLAFWINAYNAVTIKGILREYPTTSIRNHTARLYGYNIWKDLLVVVGGNSYGLEQIEHEILRKLGEPRIHFAIVCASKSCPRLLSEAYTPDRLELQLVTNAKNFFANSANFRYDQSRGRFYLSSILKWFADDFGPNDPARLRKIAPYLPTRNAYDAAANGSVSISYLSYDWSLNDQKTARAARR